MDSTLNTQYAIPEGSAIAQMIQARAVMAPMSGITDVSFRLIARKFGCAFAFTEMIDVNGIIYNNHKSLQLLETGPGEGPLGVQLVGQDEVKLSQVARICEEKGFRIVDLNAGCPARKIIKGGKGSALLKSPGKLAKIIRKMVKAVNIPVTVKIRSGWDKENLNYLEIARVAEAEGASAICIHTRTKAAMYKGKADHDITRLLKEKISIPVIASGNIFHPRDVEEVMEFTGCDAVAVARGALGKPWIFSQIKEYLSKGTVPEGPSFRELKNIIKEHFSISLEFVGETRTFPRMYKHLAWYLSGFKDLGHIMREYSGIKDPAAFMEFIERLCLDERNHLQLETV